MKPAQCAICGKYSIEEPSKARGDWVEFANFIPGSENLSHQDGLEYLCASHLNAAQALNHLTSVEAIVRISGVTSSVPPPLRQASKPSFFQKLIEFIF
jgi:hypothetical protein